MIKKLNKTVITGDRIVLHYPHILPKDEVRLFLDREERALKRAEELLKVQYHDRVKVFIHMSLFNKSWTDSQGIHYSASLTEFQELFKGCILGELHEWTHFLALRLLCPTMDIKPPGLFLTEGLATAVDALIEPDYEVHLHLVAKGLGQLGKLKPVTQMCAGDPQEAGSFTLFLLKRYGLGKLKKLYTCIDKPEKFNNRFKQIYNRPLTLLEEEWNKMLTTFLPDESERSRYLASASLELGQLHHTLLEYEKHWFSKGLTKHLPNEVFRKENTLYRAFFSLGQSSFSCGPRQAYRIFQDALGDYRAALGNWQGSIQAFDKAKQLIIYHEDYDSVLTMLEGAYVLAQAIDDAYMMRKIHYCSKIIKTLKEAQETQDHDEAKRLLQEADKVIQLYSKEGEKYGTV
jgi:hypothetical protein